MAWTNESEGKLGDSYLTKDDSGYILKDDGNKLIIFENVQYTNESEG